MPETILFIQSGDYRQAYRDFESGGEETYLEQKASVEFVANLSERLNVVVVAVSSAPYDEHLTPTLRAIGIPEDIFYDPDIGREVFSRTMPDLAILRVPQPGLLAVLGESGIPSMPLFADIYQSHFAERSPLDFARRWVRNRRVKRLLAALAPTAVGNHTLSASLSLASVLDLPEEIIIPWEWTPITPSTDVRSRPEGKVRLLFAGVISEVKGVGDLLAAVEHLVSDGLEIELMIAGKGADLDRYQSLAANSVLKDSVTFLGRIAHSKIEQLMREVHAVVVPSQHAYPEGLPNVIFETLAARTPLIASDHPAWVRRLKHDENALIYRQRDSRDLADQIVRIGQDDALYSKLSHNGAAALQGLYVGTSWYELVELFIRDPSNSTNWRESRSLAAMRRDRPELFQ